MSYEASDTSAMMKSKPSIVSTVRSFNLLSLDLFCDVGFVGETFILFDGYASSRGFHGGVTLPCSYLSSSPSFSYFSSLSTSPPPPAPGESKAESSEALLSSYTSSFFFLILLLGAL
jgi:hypothetical protein